MKRGKEVFVLGILFCIIVIPFIFAETLESDETSTNLNIEGGILCDSTGNFWLDTSLGVKTYTTELGNCFREDGKNFDATMDQTGCCPLQQDCTNEGWGYYCKTRVVSKYLCFEFNNSQDDCEGTMDTVGNYDGNLAVANFTNYQRGGFCGIDTHTWTKPDGSVCYNVTKCKCDWVNNACDLDLNVSNICFKDNTQTEDAQGRCDIKCIPPYCPKDECDSSGYRIFQMKGTVFGDYPYPTECETMKELKSPCESVTKLGFFDFINFIETIFIIALVYFIYAYKFKHEE